MLAAVGLAGLGAGVLVLWSALANVSPLDVLRETFDPDRDAGDRQQLAAPVTGAPPLDGGAQGQALGPLSNVHGIIVSSAIAGNVRALLDHAQRDGIVLRGSGFRSNKRQRDLYAQNCPNDVCKIPTARPGTSMHEKGLAIDFTHNGTTIKSQSSPAFRWLAANAARYGLSNLPSEPWHWSTTGR